MLSCVFRERRIFSCPLGIFHIQQRHYSVIDDKEIEMATFIRLVELKRRLGLKSSEAIWGRLRESGKYYDPEFPKPVKIGSATAWVEHEVDAYMERIIAQRDAAAGK